MNTIWLPLLIVALVSGHVGWLIGYWFGGKKGIALCKELLEKSRKDLKL